MENTIQIKNRKRKPIKLKLQALITIIDKIDNKNYDKKSFNLFYHIYNYLNENYTKDNELYHSVSDIWFASKNRKIVHSQVSQYLGILLHLKLVENISDGKYELYRLIPGKYEKYKKEILTFKERINNLKL